MTESAPDRPVLLRCRSCGALNRVPLAKLADRPVCGKCKTPLRVYTSPVNVTAAAFDNVVFSFPGHVLVEFWSPTCGHCRAIEPVVGELAATRPGRLLVVKADIDSEPALAARFAVRGTPVFIMFKNKTQLARLDGAPQEHRQLIGWVDGFLG